jgi:enoyl-CoA hydratase
MNTITYHQSSPAIGIITLSDPPSRNAMTEEMASEFSSLTCELSRETANLRVIIITGAGSSFSSGGNLEMLDKKRHLSGEENRLNMLSFYRAFLGIRSLGIPLIAAINGHAIGAGLCLACGCDIRIASNEAKLGFPFVQLGLYPGMGATYLLSAVVGQAKASELLLTGRIIDAAEAFAIGLISETVPHEEITKRAQQIAEEIVSAAPETIRQLLPALRTPAPTLEDTLSREAMAQAVSYASVEFGTRLNRARTKRGAASK